MAAETEIHDLLQPSLLDRLIDDEPRKHTEPRDRRVLSMAQLRAAVRRDLTWLLNTKCLEAVQSLENYPEVEKSVLNYGIQDFTGQTISAADILELERQIRDAIREYEPRIFRDSIRVRVIVDEEDRESIRMRRGRHAVITFEIEGDLWAEPAVEHLLMRTYVDLETGDVSCE